MRKLTCLLCGVLALTLATIAQAAQPQNTTADAPLGYIVKIDHQKLADSGLEPGEHLIPIPYADGFYTTDSQEDLTPFVDAGVVDYFEENQVITLPDPEDTPTLISAGDDPDYTAHYDLISMASAWTAGLDGTGVTIAVIDSGIYENHQEFDGLNISTYSYNFVGSNTDLSDGTGHGSFVTGIIAADHDETGIDGAVPKVEVMVLKTFTSSSGTTANILSAIGYAVTNGADVINMSFGGNGTIYTTAIDTALTAAYEAGILLVSSAGNDGNATVYYPAGFDYVVGVGMVYSDGTVADNSQKNSSVFVTAPGKAMWGVDIDSTDDYKQDGGTSYASPVIASLGVMAKQVAPNMTMDGFFDLLQLSVDDKGDDGYDTSYGWGLINVDTFTQNLTGSTTITYHLNSGTNPETAPTTYIVGRGNDTVTLPIPTKTDYVFEGWYQTEDFSDEAMATTLSYDQVGALTLYAKWSFDSDLAVQSITVAGYSANLVDGSDTNYLVTVPSNITTVTATDFAVTTDATVGDITYDTHHWTVTVTSGDKSITYTVTVQTSDKSAPTVLSSAIDGTATPASLDGLTAVVAYTVGVSTLFNNVDCDTVYTVTDRDAVTLEGTTLTFTPSATDAGSTVILTVSACNGSFASGDITITIAVGTSMIKHTVEFIRDLIIYNTIYVSDGDTLTLPTAPTKTGYTFLGWFDGETGGTQYTADSVITANLTLYAQFEEESTDTGDTDTGDTGSTDTGSTDTGSSGSTGSSGGGGGGSSSSTTTEEDEEETEEEVEEEFDGAYLHADISDWENPFTDVPDDAWYYEAVATMHVTGLVLGTSDTTFSPGTAVSRQQLWTILARMADTEVENFQDAQSWAVENGISDGSNPADTLSREQLVTLLWRYAGEPEGTALPEDFKDAHTISAYAEQAFQWAYEQGILQGTSNTTLSPKGTVTRAQVVVILSRYLGA